MPREGVPGTAPQPEKVYGEEADAVWAAISTVDNRLDDLVGARPLRAVGRMATSLAPANVVRNVTGVEKPSEKVEEFLDDAEERIRRLGR